MSIKEPTYSLIGQYIRPNLYGPFFHPVKTTPESDGAHTAFNDVK